MGVDKKKSQYPLLLWGDVDVDTRFDLLDGSPLDNYMIPYGDLSGTLGLLYRIWDDLFNTWNTETIAADSDKTINLGLASAYRYIKIEFIAERGSKVRGGEIEVLNTGVINRADYTWLDSEDDDTWLICHQSLAISPQVQIKLTTDNADVTDTTFKYRIVTKIPKV